MANVTAVIDIGSSSIRCTTIDVSDTSRNAHSRVPNILCPDGTFEPISVLEAVAATLSRCVMSHRQLFGSCTLRDVAFACVAMSMLAVDESTGEPITPVFTYANRAAGAAAALEQFKLSNIGRSANTTDSANRAANLAARVHDRTGAPLHPAYAPAQLFMQYLQRSDLRDRPGLVWTSLPSWIISRLAGVSLKEVGISHSEAAWSGLASMHDIPPEGKAGSRRSTAADAAALSDTAAALSASPAVLRAAPTDPQSDSCTDGCSSGIDAEVLKLAGASPLQFSPVRGSNFLVAAANLNIAAVDGCDSNSIRMDNVRLWPGIGDGAAAAVGSGALDAALLSLTVGTSAALRTVLPLADAISVLCDGECDNAKGGDRDAPVVATTCGTASMSLDSGAGRRPQEDGTGVNVNGCEFSCGTCGRLRLSKLGLWCYRFTDSHCLIGGALTDGGSIIDRLCRQYGLEVGSLDDEYRNAGVALQSPQLMDGRDASNASNTGIAGITQSRVARASTLLCLPFWSGERSTGWDPSATGTYHGITHDTKPIDMVVAAMEGVAFRVRAIYERLRRVMERIQVLKLKQNGRELDQQHLSADLGLGTLGPSTATSATASGGSAPSSSTSSSSSSTASSPAPSSSMEMPPVIASGAGLTNSALWCQIFADVLGVPVQVQGQGAAAAAATACTAAATATTGSSTQNGHGLQLEATTLGAYLLVQKYSSSPSSSAAASSLASITATEHVQGIEQYGSTQLNPSSSSSASASLTFHACRRMVAAYTNSYRRHCLLYDAVARLNQELAIAAPARGGDGSLRR